MVPNPYFRLDYIEITFFSFICSAETARVNRFMSPQIYAYKKNRTTLQFFLPLITAHCACTNKAVGVSSVVKFL